MPFVWEIRVLIAKGCLREQGCLDWSVFRFPRAHMPLRRVRGGQKNTPVPRQSEFTG
jgi:hypothetical protein